MFEQLLQIVETPETFLLPLQGPHEGGGARHASLVRNLHGISQLFDGDPHVMDALGGIERTRFIKRGIKALRPAHEPRRKYASPARVDLTLFFPSCLLPLPQAFVLLSVVIANAFELTDQFREVAHRRVRRQFVAKRAPARGDLPAYRLDRLARDCVGSRVPVQNIQLDIKLAYRSEVTRELTHLLIELLHLCGRRRGGNDRQGFAYATRRDTCLVESDGPAIDEVRPDRAQLVQPLSPKPVTGSRCVHARMRGRVQAVRLLPSIIGSPYDSDNPLFIKQMRIAAIDCGTNSIHMIVVRIRPDLSFEVIDREKEMVRLGSGGLDGKSLTDEAMAAGLQTFSRFRRLAASHQVEEILAAATSAVREAENGGRFLAAVERETGIRPQVISGTEEARLIHLAAIYGVDVAGASAVVLDIGGGSVEITHGAGPLLRVAKSFKLGVIRLTERYVHSDPLSGRDERKLVRHIDEELANYLAEIRTAGFDRVIGTSGTILSLGTVASADRRRSSDDIRNLRVPAKLIHQLRKEITARSITERIKLPGLDPRRADLIVSGAVLLDTMLRRLEATEITLCDLALREGLVLDYIQRNRKHIAQAGQYPDVRRRSVIELAERCTYWPEHAQQIARLALSVFDQTRSIHGLTDREREWLEFAAILHDIGTHISYEGHHKHSYYLIKNGDLRGFEPEESEIIALIARYHRKNAPRKANPAFRGLSTKQRRAVRTLAAILRFAETLDRSHAQVITSVELHDRSEEYLVKLRASGDAELELWAAQRQTEPLERALGKPIRLSAGKTSYAEQPEHAARVPGKAVRGRRDRRVGKNDTTGTAGQMAERRRSARVRDRVELLGTGKGRDKDGQEEERPDADDLQPPTRH
jgi:exopolyphosphatase / guanosine-5'-triphosphate,3'-diphosphate pyrophosphatase